VGREWLPRRVRLRRRRDEREPPDFPDPGWLLDSAELSAGGGLAALVVVIAAVTVLYVVWPVVAVAIELVLLVVLFLAGLAGRIALRRPWRVVARSKDPPREIARQVVGWRASRETIDAMAAALAAGRDPDAPTARLTAAPH
jgi:hypothetical protein